MGGIIIFCLSLILSSIVLGTLKQSLHAIYIFYCFDKKLTALGNKNYSMPTEIKQAFRECSGNQDITEVTMEHIDYYIP